MSDRTCGRRLCKVCVLPALLPVPSEPPPPPVTTGDAGAGLLRLRRLKTLASYAWNSSIQLRPLAAGAVGGLGVGVVGARSKLGRRNDRGSVGGGSRTRPSGSHWPKRKRKQEGTPRGV